MNNQAKYYEMRDATLKALDLGDKLEVDEGVYIDKTLAIKDTIIGSPLVIEAEDEDGEAAPTTDPVIDLLKEKPDDGA